MARAAKVKEPVNKAEEIRNYVAKHPDARNKDVVEALLAQGIDVSPSQVSQTRAAVEGGDEKPAAKRTRKIAAKDVDVTTVLQVVSEMGGFDEAQAALAKATKLQETFGTLESASSRMQEVKGLAALFAGMNAAGEKVPAGKKQS